MIRQIDPTRTEEIIVRWYVPGRRVAIFRYAVRVDRDFISWE